MSIVCAVAKDCDPGKTIQVCILIFLWLGSSTATGVMRIWFSLLVP